MIGVSFDDSYFHHAILIIQDMLATDLYTADDFSLLWQNFQIFIGEYEDYTKNALCGNEPFLRTDDPKSYVFDQANHGFGIDNFS